MNTKIPSQGACRLAFAEESKRPRDGESIGRPNPRKSRDVIAVPADTMVNGMNVTSVAMTLGNMWRKMILELDAPMTRAEAI